jgi:hypothetical protein
MIIQNHEVSKKLLIIQNKSEYDYVVLNKNNFKNITKIIWLPITFQTKQSKDFIEASSFLKRDVKNICNINYEFKFDFFLKKIDEAIKRNLKINLNYLNFFPNTKQEFKNFFDHYYNEFAKVNYLLKKYNFNEVILFKGNNEKKFNYKLNYIFKLLKIKIKIKEIEISLNSKNNLNFYLDKNLLPNFLISNNSFTNKLKNYVKNIIYNKLIGERSNILILESNTELDVLLRECKNNFKFYFIKNFFFKKNNNNFERRTNNKLFQDIKNICNVYVKNFYTKKHNININQFFYDFIKEFYKDVINEGINIFNEIRKIDTKKNFKCCVSQQEVFYSNIIHDYFVNNKKKFLTLSHGGTIGHYKNEPRVPFYTLNTNFYSHYQSFSFQIKKEIKKIISLNHKFKKYSLKIMPHLKMAKIKKFINKKKTYKKNVVYFDSPLNSYQDSKFNVHNEFNLLRIREKYYKCTKNYNLHIKFERHDDLHKKYIKYVKDNYKNITIIDKKTKIEKVLDYADIIICEGNQTTIIEAMLTNKPIICFLREYPILNFDSQKLLSKRITFLKNNTEINDFFYNFDKNLFSKKINTHNGKKFIDKYYFLKNLNNNFFVQKLNEYFNK